MLKSASAIEPSGESGGRSAVQTTMSPSCITWPLRVAVWSMRMTSGLVSSLRVASSSRVRLAPRMRGERAIDHRVSRVCCSVGVRRVSRELPQPGTGPMWPMGSMSASGQLPGLV